MNGRDEGKRRRIGMRGGGGFELKYEKDKGSEKKGSEEEGEEEGKGAN